MQTSLFRYFAYLLPANLMLYSVRIIHPVGSWWRRLSTIWILFGLSCSPTWMTALIQSTIPLPNVLFVHWLLSVRTRYSSEVTRWPASQRYIILLSPLAGCRVCLCLIISRDFSVKLLKDVGIMNICYPWQSDWSNNKY